MDEILTKVSGTIEFLAPILLVGIAVTAPMMVVTWWLEFLARIFDNRD